MNLHLKFMILCVTCAFNWFAQAYNTVKTLVRKFPKLYSGNIKRSFSGVFSSMMKSTSQLNMINVSNHFNKYFIPQQFIIY